MAAQPAQCRRGEGLSADASSTCLLLGIHRATLTSLDNDHDQEDTSPVEFMIRPPAIVWTRLKIRHGQKRPTAQSQNRRRAPVRDFCKGGHRTDPPSPESRTTQISAKLTPCVSALVHDPALLGRAAMCSKLLRHLGGRGDSHPVAGPWAQSTQAPRGGGKRSSRSQA